MLVENRDFSIPPAFDATLRGSAIVILPYFAVWYWNTRMVCCPTVKKLTIFRSFNTIAACDLQSVGHLVTA